MENATNTTDPNRYEGDRIAHKLEAARLYADKVETGGTVIDAQALKTLEMLDLVRAECDRVEARMYEALGHNGHSWTRIAELTGRNTKQAAQQRHKSITTGHLYLVTRKPDPSADPEFLALCEAREDARTVALDYNERFEHSHIDPARAVVRRVAPSFATDHPNAPAITPASR